MHLSGLEVRSAANEASDAIEIRHVGLRPGEKLYEELLIGSNVEGTQHPLIMRAQENEIPWAELQTLLLELQRACDQFDYAQVRAMLLQIVSEYAPQCGIEDFLWLEKNGLSGTGDNLSQPLESDVPVVKPGLRQVS